MIFKYKLGQTVRLDPTNNGKGTVGRVTGLIQFEGSQEPGYFVSVASWDRGGSIVRHTVSEHELSTIGIDK